VTLRRAGWGLYLVLAALFLAGPVAFIALYSFVDATFFRLPIPGFSLRWYREFFHSPVFSQALKSTLLLAAVVTPLCMAIAIPTAWAIARLRFRGRELLNAAILSPVVLPGVVTGIALLSLFGQLSLKDGFARMVLAMTLLCLPFAVRALAANFHGLDPASQEAARNLGAGPVTTFWRVTLPQLKPGLIAGGVFVFVETMDNFSINVFLADTRSKTLPIAAFEHVRDFDDPTVAAMATLLSALSVLIVLVVDRIVGLDRFLRYS
jgi:putative spermidine/putrescine transport system permease protein